MAKNGKGANGKGTEGKKTGSATRKAIASKMRGGSTAAQIAAKVNRSPSTIAKIKSGDIKNPPKSLSGKIRSSKPVKRKMTKR